MGRNQPVTMMSERASSPPSGGPARINLKTYSANLPLDKLTIGVDNIHYDVFLSPKFVQFTRGYLRDLIRPVAGLPFLSGLKPRAAKPPENAAFRRSLTDLMQASLTRAKYEKNIELDLLLRVSLLKFLTQEISNQFADLILEGKEWIRQRGEYFERSEQAHVMKAKLSELQADRRNVFRQVGQHVYQILADLEENIISRSRRALFGEEAADGYEMLKNRFVSVESGKDDALLLQHYVLLGNYLRDQDRFETIDALLLDFLSEFVVAGGHGEEMSKAWKAHQALVDSALATRAELARLEEERDSLSRRLEKGNNLLARVAWRSDPAQTRAALTDVGRRYSFLQQKLEEMGPRLEAAKQKTEYLTEQYRSQLGDYLNAPDNAQRLFHPEAETGESGGSAEARAKLLDEWLARLEQRDLLLHVLASYEMNNLHREYCPPVHLQQLKKALIFREELKQVEEILKQFPARRFSLSRIEEASKKIRRCPPEEKRAIAMRFAQDFMRLRRDSRDYQRLAAAMERVNMIRAEPTRELSRLNSSLYEFLLPDEARPAEDRVVAHAVIKADVRGSTQITKDLLARGLNPASHLSLNLYEPVKRILERYGAVKVFIEGDAIVLAIFETESNRAQQRAVSKACLLAREILALTQAYNDREEASDLPRLELGIGIAYQSSPPTYLADGDSRIMISRALNLSDRLSSCSRVARRLLAQKPSLFNLFLFQTVMEGAPEEEADEFLIRFNENGVELNEEGFVKLSEETSLNAIETECALPWGRDHVAFYYGEVPIGESVEPILLRKGFVRHLLPDGKIGVAGTRAYYELCTGAKVFELIEALERAAALKL